MPWLVTQVLKFSYTTLLHTCLQYLSEVGLSEHICQCLKQSAKKRAATLVTLTSELSCRNVKVTHKCNCTMVVYLYSRLIVWVETEHQSEHTVIWHQ